MSAASVLRGGAVITGRDLRHWRREPWGPVFGLAFSVMLLVVFGTFLGGAMTVPGGGDYLAFLVPGMLALTMAFGVESTTTAVAEDAKAGITDRFRSLPVADVVVALGRAGADMVTSVAHLAVLVLGGLALGWRTDAGLASTAAAIGLLLLLRLAMLWVGIYLGLVFPASSVTPAVQVLVWPVGLLSTAIVSAESMPSWLGAIAAWNPVSATATAVRDLFGNPTGASQLPLSEHAALLA
ncbi:MAG TPA: ABC transporter permease, partial [Actinotalea sp.]|nr:ABC transporter permease [Actinotalea sp.]